LGGLTFFSFLVFLHLSKMGLTPTELSLQSGVANLLVIRRFGFGGVRLACQAPAAFWAKWFRQPAGFARRNWRKWPGSMVSQFSGRGAWPASWVLRLTHFRTSRFAN
jgi:hypothetical protein